MTVIAVLVGLCALAVVVLAYLVGKLSGQIRQLGSELGAARRRADDVERRVDEAERRVDEAERRVDEAERHADDVERRAEAVEQVVEQVVESSAPAPEVAQQLLTVVEEVPVITALPDNDDDLDITARRVASVTLARPLIKVASLSYGLRYALDDERRFKVRYAMRQEFRRQRKMRRRRRAGRAPSMGWRS